MPSGSRAARRCNEFAELPSRAWKKAKRDEFRKAQYGPGARPVSTSEKNIGTDMFQRILPFIERVGVGGTFKGQGGVDINFWKFEHPHEKGAIVISHGFSENISYYPELIFNLYERGYSVYFLDHRGHGSSGRMTGRTMPVYVDKFQNYALDLKTFMDDRVKAKPHEKTVLLGHSMGGLVSTLYLKDNKGAVDKLILSAPLFKPNLHGLPHILASGVAQVMRTLGMGSWYAPGQGPKPTMALGFEGNLLTSSRNRFSSKWKIFNHEPEDHRNNGATYGWLAETIGACSRGRCAGPEIDVPVLVFKAGNDKVVLNSAMDKFCGGLKNCIIKRFDDAKHDILSERDEIRDPLMTQLFEFIESPPTQTFPPADSPEAEPGR